MRRDYTRWRTSAVEVAHALRGIALAGGGAHLVEAAQFFGRQPDRQCPGVLLEILAALRAGDGHDVLSPGEDPGERKLRSGHFLFARDLFHAGDEPQVALEVLPLEARVVAPVVVGD